MKKIKLGNKYVGADCPVYIVAEAGCSHCGDFNYAKRQIDAAKESGADAIKFQAWKTENRVSQKVAKEIKKELGFDWFSRLKEKELSFEQLRKLQEYAEKKGIIFFATAHDEESLMFIDKELNVPFFKIGSGEVGNHEFLKKVGYRKKPVIISVGLHTKKEIITAVNCLKSTGNSQIVVLHCVTLYPTPPEKIGLLSIKKLKKILNLPVGLSDHSVGYHIPLASIPLGAALIEKHLTFDKTDSRSLDNPGALLPDEFTKMVKEIREIEKALTYISDKERISFLSKSRNWMAKAIVAARDIPPKTVIKRKDLVFKMPLKGGILANQVTLVLGKKVNNFIAKDQQITLEDLES